MKKLCLLWLLCASVTVLAGQSLKPFAGFVCWIKDGDSVLIRSNGHKVEVRLWGVDAPEYKQQGGKEALRFLIKLIKGKNVKVVPVESGKYGRLIAKIYYGKKYVNLEIIKAGHGWWYKYYALKAKDFEQAQEEAKKAKRGLWAADNPINPREYRKRHKKKK